MSFLVIENKLKTKYILFYLNLFDLILYFNLMVQNKKYIYKIRDYMLIKNNDIYIKFKDWEIFYYIY